MNLKYTALFFLCALLFVGAYYTYSVQFSPRALTNPVYEAAEDYKASTGSYGIVTNAKSTHCFERNSFLVTDKVRVALEKPSVTGVSCKFSLENSVIQGWSVSIIEGEKVTCIDSTGFAQVTPGVTLTARCTGE